MAMEKLWILYIQVYVRKVTVTIEFTDKIYCLTLSFFIFFIFPFEYFTIAYKTCKFMFSTWIFTGTEGSYSWGEKKTNVFLFRTRVFEACAYWILDMHVVGWGSRRRFYGFLYAREEIINVLCFINLTSATRGRRKSPPDDEDGYVGFQSRRVTCILYYVCLYIYIYIYIWKTLHWDLKYKGMTNIYIYYYRMLDVII